MHDDTAWVQSMMSGECSVVGQRLEPTGAWLPKGRPVATDGPFWEPKSHGLEVVFAAVVHKEGTALDGNGRRRNGRSTGPSGRLSFSFWSDAV